MFQDRVEAGRNLAERLEGYKDDCVVVGLPRGGMIVAAEVAQALNAPLDVVVARKLGAPVQPELGVGAIASGDVRVIDRNLIQRLDISDKRLEEIAQRELEELHRREEEYRSVSPKVDLAEKTVIMVDDGLATGVTALAAAHSIRRNHPLKLIAAFPVCSPRGAQVLENHVDEIICCAMPEDLGAVGQYYEDFTQTTDEEVLEALERANAKAK